MFKFSGVAATTTDGPADVTFLADIGYDSGTPRETTAVGYPLPAARTVVSMSVNIPSVLAGGSVVVVELLDNGVLVPGFVLTFNATGVQTVTPAPVTIAANHLINVRVTGSGSDQAFDIAAVVAFA